MIFNINSTRGQTRFLTCVARVKPGVHTNDFATIHGRPARIHTAPAESTIDSTYCLPQAVRRCVNTHGATVNRGEIVSMYAGLNLSSLYKF